MAQKFNADGHVENLWKSLKNDLPSATDKSCGWTKGSSRHKKLANPDAVKHLM